MEGETSVKMVRKEQELKYEVSKKEFVITPETSNLIAAVGNSEAKGITLGAMQEGVIYPYKALGKRILELQGSNPGWEIDARTLFAYCKESLSPIGLLTTELIDPNLHAWGYVKTPYGEETGEGLTGHLLKWSLEHPNTSLYKFFGKTQSSPKPKDSLDGIEQKRRSPELRLRILQKILTSASPIRDVDLVRGLGEQQGLISPHLSNLGAFAIIGYEARERGHSYSFYSLSSIHPDGFPATVSGMKSLTQEVYQLLLERPNEFLSAEEAERLLRQKYPHKYGEKKKVSNLASMLSGLERQGFLAHQGFRANSQSKITLTNEQREVISSMLNIIDAFQSGNRQFLEQGRRVLGEILTDPNKVATLLKKAKESSPDANRFPLDKTHSLMFSVIGSHPNLTALQIRDKLEEIYGKKLSTLRIRAILRELKGKNNLRSGHTEAGNVYYFSQE